MENECIPPSSTRIIHAWSGPRSLSTALMYSFSQRPDCQTYDEPLYANYLRNFATLHRPYRYQLLEKRPESGDDVIQSIITESKEKSKLIFVKHIVKQLTNEINFDLFLEPGTVHLILIRNPLDMILSWNQKESVHNEAIGIDATNVLDLVNLFFKLKKIGITPVVVDADELKRNPEKILSELCSRLNIPFYREQLTWPAGPKPDIDGLWASYWYDSVHKSSGFHSPGPPRTDTVSPISVENYPTFRDAFYLYDMLRNYAVGIQSFERGLSHCPPAVHASFQQGVVCDHGRQISSDSLSDSRNGGTLLWVGNRLVPRECAKVSVFDSTVQGGDAVWEGLRVYDGRVFKLEEHLERLLDSAKAMAFERVPEKEFIRQAIFKTLKANGMLTDTHIRLTLSRGTKVSSSMNPLFNIFGCVLLIVPEWKPVGNAATYDNAAGIKLITAAGRRNTSSCLDSKIHHCNLINNILPKIQANQAGAADALMLDIDGFVSETNATNVFMVKRGIIYTPCADSCLPGITRQTIIDLVSKLPDFPPVVEKRLSLVEFHTADEVFTTGTMGELTPVKEIDGRTIGNGERPVTKYLQNIYHELTQKEGVPIPI